MSNIRVAYTGFISFFVAIITIITGGVFTLILTRTLTQEEFGTWGLIIGITQYVIIFGAIITFWSTRDTARKIESEKTAILGNMLLSVIAMVLYIGIAYFLGNAAKIDLITFSDHGITFADFELEDDLVNTILVKSKRDRNKTIKELKKNKYDLFIQLPQNLGLYKSIRNMIIVRFFMNIKSGFGWDYGRIKSFINTQKKYLPIPTETLRLLNNLKAAGLNGEMSYPIKAIKPANQAVTDLLKQKIV